MQVASRDSFRSNAALADSTTGQLSGSVGGAGPTFHSTARIAWYFGFPEASFLWQYDHTVGPAAAV